MYYAIYDKGKFYQKKGRLGRRFPTPYLSGRAFRVIRERLKSNPGKWLPLD